MKLLLDQGLPRSASYLLTEAGIDTTHVSDLSLSDADDQEILQQARENDQIIVTLDADFHTLLALSQVSSPSVIRVRIERLRAQTLADLILRVTDECRVELQQGAVVTVEQTRFRMRRLPLIKEN